jgi:hypothetical protein
MRQTVLLLKVQTHLMAGLKFGSLSMSVLVSVAAPVHGSPLMFHDAVAFCPSFANTAFSAAASVGSVLVPVGC